MLFTHILLTGGVVKSERLHYELLIPVNSINTGTITPGESLMLE